MPKTCNNCGTEKTPATVPYVVHKSAMARAERQSKRLVAVIVILIALFAGYVAFDKWHDSQYEDVVETEGIIVDAEDSGIANYIGNDGDIYNGKDNGKEN